MKFAIDGYEANVPQRLGSSQVAYELLVNLEKIDKKNSYTILLPSEPLADLPPERDGWSYKVIRFNKLWTRIALPLYLYTAKEKFDLVFSPTHYIPRFSPIKRVGMIFDLSYLHFKEMLKKGDLYKLTNWSKFTIQKSNHLITISNFSKNDILKNYEIPKDKITVAYPGFREDIFKPQDEESIGKIKNKYQINDKYIIYIGTIQPRKNLIRLIEAFKKVLENYPGTKLVLVGKTKGQGKEGWMFEETLSKPKEIGIESDVIFTGFAPTEDLPALAAGSEAFVCVSLWEGFGIPVVEAMATGTPVIVSNVSSLPEVVGEAGIMVDPYSSEQIAQAISTVLSDKKIKQERSKKSLERAKAFSWQKMAQVTLETLEKTAAS